MKLTSLTLAACIALASAGTAFAGGKSTANAPATPNAAAIAAAWKNVSGYSASSVTVENGKYVITFNGTQLSLSSGWVTNVLLVYFAS